VSWSGSLEYCELLAHRLTVSDRYSYLHPLERLSVQLFHVALVADTWLFVVLVDLGLFR
jgi:hypothetical protein